MICLNDNSSFSGKKIQINIGNSLNNVLKVQLLLAKKEEKVKHTTV